MPFTKVGKDSYVSPSGRHYNEAQVRLWYAKGGKFPGEKGPGELKSAKPKRKPNKPAAPKVGRGVLY